MKKFHRLLQRQLKKAGMDTDLSLKMRSFLLQVDEAYRSFDIDLQHLETILEKSSQELFVANKQLKTNMEAISDQLSKVAGNIKEVIFEVDLDGKWSYVNPAWEELMGYSIEETIGRSCFDFIQDQKGKPLRQMAILKKKDFKSTQLIVEILTGKGEVKWVDIFVKCMNGLNGNEGCIGTIVDITDLKKTELALLEANKRANLANEAKDDFLSTMSHEIRTPLNAVIGVSHLLLLENPKKEQLENLQALKYSSEHLLELVNDILDFNKITSGSIELEQADFSLERVLNGLQSLFQHKAKQKDIRFSIKTDRDLPARLVGDSTRITQILSNLINNAIKFTEEGKVVLDVGLEARKEDSCTIHFSVIDTGIGIPEEKQEKIFDSFCQANSDTTRKYGGTGLGLAICKRLVEHMGGKLTVESTLGKGSTFSFELELPISTVIEINREGKLPSKTLTMTTTLDSLKGTKMLVAEDNQLNILVIRKFLSKWNVDYEIVEDGKAAVAKAEQNNYDLILMDLQMPEMNGFDAARAIRQGQNPKNKTIPIYALSASTGVDINTKIQEYGINGLISKPFDPTELYGTLCKIVDHQSFAS